MRRSRKTDWMRRLVRENSLSSNDFILPIFVTEGENKKIPVKTMPDYFLLFHIKYLILNFQYL